MERSPAGSNIARPILRPLYHALRMCMLAGMLILAGASSYAQCSQEYQVKSAFILNFTQFTEWPASSFSSASADLVIGVLGKDPFGTCLDKIVAGEKVNGHNIVVKRFNAVEEVSGCHMLFIDVDRKELTNTLSLLKGKAILTVSDNSSFAKEGGMIQFFLENSRVRLRINTQAASAANIVLSSKLLRLAEIYPPAK